MAHTLAATGIGIEAGVWSVADVRRLTTTPDLPQLDSDGRRTLIVSTRVFAKASLSVKTKEI